MVNKLKIQDLIAVIQTVIIIGGVLWGGAVVVSKIDHVYKNQDSIIQKGEEISDNQVIIQQRQAGISIDVRRNREDILELRRKDYNNKALLPNTNNL